MVVTAFSAPGKALLAGGYLVLFPEYSAYSVALSSRMHAVAESAPSKAISVASPQFDSQWAYNVEDYPPAVTSQTHKNPFVEAVLKVVRAYYGEEIRGGSITVYSDDGFHSQTESVPSAIARFKNHGKVITEVPKTGLGSSAALCVVVTAAAVGLQATGAEETSEWRDLIHNLAQVAHSLAQGKVGSGFDVATAVYGSIQYSRFSPALIPLEADSQALKQAVNASWDQVTRPIAIPTSLTIVMGDVVGGSETPSMVKKVLEWRKTKPEEAGPVWDALAAANTAFTEALRQNASSIQLRAKIDDIRKQLKAMTTFSGVPIEPDEQTAVLDYAAETDGVINGVVPGAGGHDAVALLVEKPKLGSILASLRKDSRLSHVNWLELAPEPQGLTVEAPESYRS